MQKFEEEYLYKFQLFTVNFQAFQVRKMQNCCEKKNFDRLILLTFKLRTSRPAKLNKACLYAYIKGTATPD